MANETETTQPPVLRARPGERIFDLMNEALAYWAPRGEVKAALIWFAVATGVLTLGEPDDN